MAESDILIAVGADISDAAKDLDRLGNKVDALDGNVKRANTGMGGLGGSIGGLINPLTLAAGGILAVGAGLADSVGKAAAFDEKMAAIRATSGGTTEELGGLRALALQLGAANDVGSVSASDAAEAIFELGKAGVSAKDQMKGVTKSVLQLAAAAGPEFGVANAASLAADSMAIFGIAADDSTDVVNTLVGAANASTIGLEDLKFSLSAAGVAARTIGLSFQDTNRAFALFGKNGLKGADAGTSFKTMLMSLQPRTKAQTVAMRELGLITEDGANAFFTAEGKARSLSEIGGVLKTALEGQTDAQQFATLETIFGSDALRAAAILTREGAEGVDAMSAAMTEQGDAARAAADMSNNLKGKWEALMGTIETLQISIGGALTDVLSRLVDKVNEVVGAFVAWISQPDVQKGIEDLITAVGIGLGGAFDTLKKAADTVGPPVMDFLRGVSSMVEPLRPMAGLFGDIAAIILNQVVPAADKFLKGDYKGAEEQFSFAMGGIKNRLTDIEQAFNEFSTNVKTWFDTELLPKAKTGIEAFVKAWENSTPKIKKTLDDMTVDYDKFLADLEFRFSHGQSIIETGADGWITAMAPRIAKLISDTSGAFFNFFTKVIADTIMWGADMVVEFAAWIPDAITGILAGLAQMVRDLAHWFSQTIIDAKNEAIKIGDNILLGIRQGITQGWTSFTTWLTNKIKSIIGVAQASIGADSPARLFIPVGESIPWGLAVGIEAGWPAVTGAMQRGLTDARHQLTDGSIATEWGRAAMGWTDSLAMGLAIGIEDGWPAVTDALQRGLTDARHQLTDGSIATEWGQAAMGWTDSLAGGITEGWGVIAGALQDGITESIRMIQGFVDQVEGMWGQVGGSFGADTIGIPGSVGGGSYGGAIGRGGGGGGFGNQRIVLQLDGRVISEVLMQNGRLRGAF